MEYDTSLSGSWLLKCSDTWFRQPLSEAPEVQTTQRKLKSDPQTSRSPANQLAKQVRRLAKQLLRLAKLSWALAHKKSRRVSFFNFFGVGVMSHSLFNSSLRCLNAKECKNRLVNFRNYGFSFRFHEPLAPTSPHLQCDCGARPGGGRKTLVPTRQISYGALRNKLENKV